MSIEEFVSTLSQLQVAQPKIFSNCSLATANLQTQILDVLVAKANISRVGMQNENYYLLT